MDTTGVRFQRILNGTKEIKILQTILVLVDVAKSEVDILTLKILISPPRTHFTLSEKYSGFQQRHWTLYLVLRIPVHYRPSGF